MKSRFDAFFHISERGTSLKKEIVGGLLSFVAMSFVIPLIAEMMSSMGMNRAGVFAMVALLSAVCTLIMGLIANFPLVVSCSIAVSAYLAYTLSSLAFPVWQQKMIILTLSGIIFFVLSLTPVRRYLLSAIPRGIRGVITACLGVFLIFIGLKGTNLIVSDATNLVKMGSFLDPAVIIGFVTLVLTVGLGFSKRRFLSAWSIPLGILFAAVVGCVVSTIMIESRALIRLGNDFVYNYADLKGVATVLPVFPTYDSSLRFGFDTKAVSEVFLFGAFNGYSNFGADLQAVFTNPLSYVGLFSLVFIILFDSSATPLALGQPIGLLNEKGEFVAYRRTILADSAGALVSGPLGGTHMVCYAQSGVGIAYGARTGLSAVIAALALLAMVFLYPVFSLFTAGSVTAAALSCVGVTIVLGSLKDIDFHDPLMASIAILAMVFSVVTYSLINGIGIAFILYIAFSLIAKRKENVSAPMLILAILFLASLILGFLPV